MERAAQDTGRLADLPLTAEQDGPSASPGYDRSQLLELGPATYKVAVMPPASKLFSVSRLD